MIKRNYDDILYREHPVSDHHPQMSRQERAGQFAPFAALTGYGAAVEETARRVDAKLELDEDRITSINQALNQLKAAEKSQPLAEITYFIPDPHKEGGQYIREQFVLRKVNEYRQVLLTTGNVAIRFENIYQIDIL